MILDNFIEVLLMQGLVNTEIRDFIGRGVTLTGGANNNYAGTSIATHVNKISELTGLGYYCMVFGTNSTPVSADDYAWDNDIDTFTYNSWGLTTVLKEGKKVMRFTQTVTNDTSEDIVVSEIGLIVCGNGGGNKFLVAREVLETPITVAANGGAQVFGIDIG